MSFEDDLHRDFPEMGTPGAQDLLRRQLACWPEPPAHERYRLKRPCSVAVLEHATGGTGGVPGVDIALRMVTLNSQEDLDRLVESGAGVGDLSVRRQLSLMCDRLPECVGLMVKPWEDEPNVIAIDPIGMAFPAADLRAAVSAAGLQERVKRRQMLVFLGKPTGGQAYLKYACGVVTRAEAEPEGSAWALRVAFDALDTPSGHAYRKLVKDGSTVLELGLVGFGPPITINGFYVAPRPK